MNPQIKKQMEESQERIKEINNALKRIQTNFIDLIQSDKALLTNQTSWSVQTSKSVGGTGMVHTVVNGIG